MKTTKSNFQHDFSPDYLSHNDLHQTLRKPRWARFTKSLLHAFVRSSWPGVIDL
ncbi:hypothetical protein HQ585_11575 [candidate division KSB1 bacterium]|nr:hypothetical protein [candidate division KSB1 bacterium]